MLTDSCELERAGIDESIVDIFYSSIIFGSVGGEVYYFIFIEEFLEMGKYRRDFEAADLRDFLERESLFQIDKSLVVWWDFLA